MAVLGTMKSRDDACEITVRGPDTYLVTELWKYVSTSLSRFFTFKLRRLFTLNARL